MSKPLVKSPVVAARVTARMLRVACLGLGLFMALATPSALAQRVLMDKIIAIVDQDVLLQSELDARLYDIREAAARDGRDLPPQEEMLNDVMEALIIENLQLQHADRVGIRFDDDMLNRVLSNMAENNNMTFDQYVDTLKENGVYLRTREEVRKQLSVQELQRGIVNQRITITDQEIDNFLNSETGREVMAEAFFIEHILIPKSAEDSAEVASEKLQFAADLISRIEEGNRLVAVRAAAQQSGFPIAGTEFGWRKADELPSLFSDIVDDMSVGDVEGPIEAGNGFHIIQLVDQQGGTDQIVNQTDIRHIMLTPNEIRDEAQTEAAIKVLRQRIVDGEEFATLARQNSDDAESVVGGGDLGWINEGGMPPEMEVVIDSLEIDELSQAYRSEVGWHISEVLGRRAEDLSQEYSRSQAANALRNRKFDMELQNWLIEIREEAFVELVE